MTVNGEIVELDNEGYLLEPKDWNLTIAGELAHRLGIAMTDDHWFVVNYVRDHFEQTGCVPEARHALKAMREQLGREKATRKYLYRLFPWGYGQMACKIAGMRKPLKLLLDL
jgi:tRNA 2-thiouridine synthesizing protein E